ALSGRAGSTDQVVAPAHSLGWDIDRPLVVVAAGVDPDSTPAGTTRDELQSLQARFTAAWSRTVQLRDARAAVVGCRQEVVVVLGAARDPEALRREVRDMVRTVSGDGGGGRRSFCTGVSRVVASAEELPEAYAQATKAVTVGRQMHG